MKMSDQIDALLQKLLSLQLAPSVQPSDLAELPFEPAYEEVVVRKTGSQVFVTVVFMDLDDRPPTRHKMRHVYDRDKRLMRIEQKVGAQPFRMQWDRAEVVRQLLDELTLRLRALNSADAVQRFLETVPEDLKARVVEKLEAVA
jgi:hypothetical protein